MTDPGEKKEGRLGGGGGTPWLLRLLDARKPGEGLSNGARV